MFTPIPHTDPAELMPASAWFSARHMHTTTVLLDGILALWTWLRVHTNPCRIAFFIPVLLFPLLNNLAGNWQMSVSAAAVTPDYTTVAAYLPSIQRFVGSPSAMLPWAPSSPSVRIIHQALYHEALVPREKWSFAEYPEDYVRAHRLAASGSWALDIQATFPGLYCRPEILLPAIQAKPRMWLSCGPVRQSLAGHHRASTFTEAYATSRQGSC
mmetsp:Transcript_28250/g.65339  ORF Transcript_28250/g.65339 Transcript_28250/m.65339 type:complete len:213 (-) Transcript_28250:418-1056(-)